MATKPNSICHRVSSTISLRMFWTVRKPISGSSRKKASTAVSPASMIAARRAARAAGAAMSDFLDIRPAEQALGQEDERDGEDRESRDVLVVGREIGRPQRLDQADQEPADHGARQRADGPHHG